MAQREVDEGFGFILGNYPGPSHDAVPGGVVLLVRLLDGGHNVLFFFPTMSFSIFVFLAPE